MAQAIRSWFVLKIMVCPVAEELIPLPQGIVHKTYEEDTRGVGMVFGYKTVILLAILGSVVGWGSAPAAKKPKHHDLHCMFFGFPDIEHDGKDRTEPLTDKNFNKTVFAKGVKAIVLFNDIDEDDKAFDQNECFLQLSAEVAERRGYSTYVVDTDKEVKLRIQEDVEDGEDTIHVYQDGYQIEYHGIREPDTFISWLMDIPDDPVDIINHKDELEEFEEADDDYIRVIGYFEPNSKDLKEFHEAAKEFMGEIEFFAVVDSYWASRVGLREVGEIHLYHPFEDEPIIAPDGLDTEDELEDWIEDNMEPVMQRLRPDNYFALWRDPEPNERMILAFVDDEEKDGKAILKLLRKIADENSEHAGTLEIVLIDPDEFPLMVDHWEETFDIDIEDGPQLGLVDISQGDGEWFDIDQLNLDETKKHSQSNLEVLQRWIDQIMDGEILIDDDDDDDEDDEDVYVPQTQKRKPQ